MTKTSPGWGRPNDFIPRILASGAEGIASCGWAPRDAEPDLVLDPMAQDPSADENLNWSAAASCYDAWFGTVYHLASRFGVRKFLTLNEPENRFGWWRLPEKLKTRCDKGWGIFSAGRTTRSPKNICVALPDNTPPLPASPGWRWMM